MTAHARSPAPVARRVSDPRHLHLSCEPLARCDARRTAASLQAYADTWASRGVQAWHEGWWEMGRTVGDLLAPILGVQPGTLSMHQNVTVAMAIIGSCFSFDGAAAADRDERSGVPVEHVPVRGLSPVRRRGGLRAAATDRIEPDLEPFLDAIDERTLLVPLSVVLFRSACIQDARAVIEKAHRVGRARDPRRVSGGRDHPPGHRGLGARTSPSADR